MIEGSYNERTNNIMEAVFREQELIVEIVSDARRSEKCLRLGSEDFSSTLTSAEAQTFVEYLERPNAKPSATDTDEMRAWIALIRRSIIRIENLNVSDRNLDGGRCAKIAIHA